MSIFASIGARLAHASRRIRAWSWPSRLGVFGGFVVGIFLAADYYLIAVLMMFGCWALIGWGGAIEYRRAVRRANQ